MASYPYWLILRVKEGDSLQPSSPVVRYKAVLQKRSYELLMHIAFHGFLAYS